MRNVRLLKVSLVIKDVGYYILSFVEPPNFPAWELYVFFVLLLFISIIFRLSRLEQKVNILTMLKEKSKD